MNAWMPKQMHHDSARTTPQPPPRPQGIIHRDVKPSNLFCAAGGLLKLGDFGVSRAGAPGAECARTVVGTPYYMSPELMEVSLVECLPCFVIGVWAECTLSPWWGRPTA